MILIQLYQLSGFLNLFYLIIYLLAALGLCCCAQAFSSCSEWGYSLLRCMGFSLQWLLLLWSMGSRHAGFSSCGTQAQQLQRAGSRACRLQQLWHFGSAVVARGLQSTGSVVVGHGLSCSAACGIFPDQGSNPCPLHWQVDSQPLRHQGSPYKLSFD